jgi:hypothetical protein
MKTETLTALVARHCRRRDPAAPPPTAEEWQALSAHFATAFPQEFVAFHELLAKYHVEGGWLTVARA